MGPRRVGAARGLGDFKHSGAPKVIKSPDGNGTEGKTKIKLKQVVCGSAYSAALMGVRRWKRGYVQARCE